MQTRPELCTDTALPSVDDIARIARELYGMDAVAEPLPGFEDLNYRLTGAGSVRVLKVASSATLAADLQLQDAVMEWLQPQLAGKIQRLIPTTAGARLGEVDSPSGLRLVRMLSYLPGRRMADLPLHSEALLRDLGGLLGRMDRRLLSFEHPHAARSIEWSLSETSRLRRWLDAVDDPHARALVTAVIDRFDTIVAPLLPALRSCVLHNDANDYNILVEEGPTPTRVAGLIDFGDSVCAPVICELAIAIAYALFAKDNPLEVAATLTQAFHQELPLAPEELDVLFDLVSSRLAMSVVLCSRELRARPQNTYLAVSTAPALRALDRLARIAPEQARARLRRACGFA